MLNVSIVKVTHALSVMTNGSSILMVHVSRTVEMETLLMTNLVRVLYVMRLVLFVMEQILVNVLHVSMVITKKKEKIPVIHVMMVVKHVSEVVIGSAANVTQTTSYNQEHIV